MENPATALLVFGVACAVLALLLWPRRGLIVRLYRLARLTERVRMEDALKHLHNQEYLGRPASIETMAGALETSRARVVKLVARLESRGLIHSDGKGLPLTDSGRAYALRIVRSHRLWERYLADQTSVKPGDWHDVAELREHTLTPDAVAELDVRMGHPRYDPHGDPIPTASGELPPQSGVALTALEPGQSGTIVHLEDEPREVYDQLIAVGLAPLMELHVLESTPSSLRFTADGSELMLQPVVASNITVQVRSTEDSESGPSRTLAQLRPGESAAVVRISPTCRGAQRRRLLDLGVVPGTVVSAELEGALRDPVAYNIRGALIALRRHQAEWIYVEAPLADSRN